MRIRSILSISTLGVAGFAFPIGCGSSSNEVSSEVDAGTDDASVHTDAGGKTDAKAPTTDGAVKTDGATSTSPAAIITIVMENHDYAEIVGSADAPYINSLIKDYGLATNYKDCGTHPSLPNYLTMISGDKQYPGIVDLPPKVPLVFPKAKDHVGTQMETAKIEWRAYQEGMTTACNLSDTGNYATRHTPFLYFSDIQKDDALCQKRVVDYSNFAADLAGGTYRYMFVAPDLINDGHDPANDPVAGLKQSDAWLAKEMPKILASDVYKNGAVVFITWDEGEGRNGNSKDQIPMIVVSKQLVSAGFKSNIDYTHSSYLATVEDMLGLPRLATVMGETAMTDFFK